eukprot:jgi/Ulvmu1/1128/UM107_0001.1
MSVFSLALLAAIVLAAAGPSATGAVATESFQEGRSLMPGGAYRKLLHACHKPRCLTLCPRCVFPKNAKSASRKNMGHCKRNGRRFNCRRRNIDGAQHNEGDEGDEGDEGGAGNDGNEGDEGDEGNEGNEGTGAAANRLQRSSVASRLEPIFYREYADGMVAEEGPAVIVSYDEWYDFSDEHGIPGDYDDDDDDDDDAAPAAASGTANGTANATAPSPASAQGNATAAEAPAPVAVKDLGSNSTSTTGAGI